MLNKTKVINYIKDNLGFPFMNLELSDEQLIEYVTRYTLVEFSDYVRYSKTLYLNLDSPSIKVPHSQNEFYIHDSEGLEIISVSHLYPDQSDYLIHGHQPLGPMTYGEIPEWMMSTMAAMDTKMFSSFDKTWEFKHPNIIRISPVVNNAGGVTIKYQTIQPSDFRGIPNELQTLFCRLALADTKIRLGTIRKRYQNLSTPFGEINIDGADLQSEGKEERREIMELLDTTFLPNLIIDHG